MKVKHKIQDVVYYLKKSVRIVIAFLNNCMPFRWIAYSVCLFVYAVATVFQTYNGGQLTYPHVSWAGLALLSG